MLKKTEIVAFGPIMSWLIEWEKVEAVTDFLPLGSKIMADSDSSHEIRRHLLLGRKAMTNLDSVLKSKGLSQISSIAQLYPILCDPMNRSMPGLPVHHQLPEFTQTQVHWVSDAIQRSHPLLSPSPPAFNLSQHQSLFQWVSSSIRWPKYCSFSFSISPSNEYSGLISFRMDWLDLLTVQRTLKSLLQHHSSKASIL